MINIENTYRRNQRNKQKEGKLFKYKAKSNNVTGHKKPELRKQILELRQQGLSYNKIVKQLGCGVTIVSYHIKTPDQPIKEFFPENIEKDKNRKRFSKIRQSILEEKIKFPNNSNAQIARDLGYSQNIVRYHLNPDAQEHALKKIYKELKIIPS